MLRLATLVGAVGLSFTIPLGADDTNKSPPRSLAADAALLSTKSHGGIWESSEVVVKQKKETLKGKLVLVFRADEEKPTGDVWFGIQFEESEIRTAKLYVFELVDKGGKRFIEVYKLKDPGAAKPEREKRPWMTLTYSINDGNLAITSTAKGGQEGDWAGHEVNLSATTTLKPWKPEYDQHAQTAN